MGLSDARRPRLLWDAALHYAALAPVPRRRALEDVADAEEACDELRRRRSPEYSPAEHVRLLGERIQLERKETTKWT
jgi:hypothetical protein